MDVKKQAAALMSRMKKRYPKARVALNYGSPMQLLVAVILSAQCTDVRVNIVTRELFGKYRSADDFAGADPADFRREISSTNFYRNKARNIIEAAKIIKKEFNGRVPDRMDDLLRLPGVGRKTANVILSAIYHKNEGICIDTHCIRLARRWGLTKSRDPAKIESELMPAIPRKDWERFTLMTIKHGREVCHARKPGCGRCFLSGICPSAFKA